ncbi:yjiC [Symbiodinium sp. CCMP2592]|nr:yjiC [Symbiodinium sp. CCMP2592]
MEQQITVEGPTIAIFNVAMIGHVNPTFALVQELRKRGCKVHYFLPPVAPIRAAAVESGAVVEGYLPDDPSDFVMEKCGIDEPLCHIVPEVLEDDRAEYERSVWPLAQALVCGEHVIERCRQLGVSVVLYDPFLPLGLLAATKLGIQGASLVTYPGMGSLSGLMSTLEAEGRLGRAATIRKPYGKAIQEKFGVDLSCNLLTRRQFYTKTNFVTTCEDLIAELPALGEQKWADELRKEFSFSAVGCLVSSSAPHVITARSDSFIPRVKSFGHSLPVAELSDQLAKGKKIIYAALGTMALSDRWGIDLGRISAANLPSGTTGKAFCQHVWKALLAAMEELGDDFFCVLSVGKQPDALDFLGRSEAEIFEHVPSNVLIRGFVPQVEMLNNYASAFISHVGFNSLQESLMAGVPLVAIPQAVDQPANASKVEQRGWGQAFFNPMETVTKTALAEALRQVMTEIETTVESEDDSYRAEPRPGGVPQVLKSFDPQGFYQILPGDFLMTHPISCIAEPVFDQAVVILHTNSDHPLTDSGVVRGLVLNKRLNTTFKQLLERAQDPQDKKWAEKLSEVPAAAELRVFRGGPVIVGSSLQANIDWVHSFPDVSEAQQVAPGVWFGGKIEEVLERAAACEEEEPPLRIMLGYAAWSTQQLQIELECGVWCRARPPQDDLPLQGGADKSSVSAKLCFDEDGAEAWRTALFQAGQDLLAQFPRAPGVDARIRGHMKRFEMQNRSKS